MQPDRDRPVRFEYRGYRLRIDVDEPVGESDSGVLMTTVVACPVLADGSDGPAVVLERNFAGIHSHRASAYDAAAHRARARIDELAARS